MRALLEVFYKWRQSRDGGPPSRQRRAELDAKVADFHRLRRRLWRPRILADLRSGASGAGLSSNRTWSTVPSSPTIRCSCTTSSMLLACSIIRQRKAVVLCGREEPLQALTAPSPPTSGFGDSLST